MFDHRGSSPAPSGAPPAQEPDILDLVAGAMNKVFAGTAARTATSPRQQRMLARAHAAISAGSGADDQQTEPRK